MQLFKRNHWKLSLFNTASSHEYSNNNICPQHRTNTNELLMRSPDVNTQYLQLSVSRCRSQLDWMRISNNHSCSDSVLTQSSQSRLLLCNETFRSMQKDIMGNIDAHYLVVVQYARILSPT